MDPAVVKVCDKVGALAPLFAIDYHDDLDLS
jgi:hypothetical protein